MKYPFFQKQSIQVSTNMDLQWKLESHEVRELKDKDILLNIRSKSCEFKLRGSNFPVY